MKMDNILPARNSAVSEALPVVDSMSYSIYAGKLEQIQLSGKKLICTINQYAYCVAENDEAFKESLQRADILLPDGIGIVAAVKFLNGKKVNKIAGYDLHNYLLKQLNKQNGSCFYLGSSETTLQKIKTRINKEYPNISFGSYSPPYKPAFSEEDNKQMVNAVNNFKPDVLFVGMTAPKQEKWSYMHKELLDTKLICSIGAAFDFYAEIIRRPARVWRSMGMEWFVRLLKEPKRMSKRYLYFGPVFIGLLIKLKMKMIFNNTNSILQTEP
jgi:N-acetylglucosaminyldiphosphoundecaprenol N-acetyl-beta-D-mannosaminyltransferase